MNSLDCTKATFWENYTEINSRVKFQVNFKGFMSFLLSTTGYSQTEYHKRGIFISKAQAIWVIINEMLLK